MKIAVFLKHKLIPLPEHHSALLERVRAAMPNIEWLLCDSEEEFLAALPQCDAAVTWYFKPEWSAVARNLRLLATPAAGREFMETGPKPGFAVWHGRFHGELMAETVAGMMLTFVRGIKETLARQDFELWPRETLTKSMRTLRGSRVVIVGFGAIGKWIGRLVKAFGAHITGVNRSDMAVPDYFSDGDAVEPLEKLDELLPLADHLVLVVPGGQETDSLIDARRLGLLSDGAYIYNVGRGNCLDADALASELSSGRLAGAGLDVYSREPLPEESPLRSAPNIILMPHVSAMAPNYLDLFFRDFLEDLRRLV